MNLKDILDDILSLVTQLSLTIRKARKPTYFSSGSMSNL